MNWLVKGAVRLVERYLPDPYVIVLLLTLLVCTLAVLVQGQSPLQVARDWGDGFWNLLTFAMQMALILITGHMVASAAPVQRGLSALARRLPGPGAAIVTVTLVALAASWLNWGFGLVVGAFLARAIAREVAVDFRLLVASAYSGFIVWHGGLSGSVPLTINTPGHFAEAQIGLIGTDQTLFAPFNLVLLAALVVVVPLLNYLMMGRHGVQAPREALAEKRVDAGRLQGPLLHSRWLTALVVMLMGLWLGQHFASGGGLNLNVLNLCFLTLGLALHQTPARLLAAFQSGCQAASGILLQFPFYAGIMAVMVKSGMAAALASWFLSFASAETLPLWSFLSAGLINLLVPSGGGQWAVQAPVMIPAAQALGADLPRVAMAVAWGDAWTNLLQPFWALPVLAIAGLSARDIMGFCLIQLLVTGVLLALGLTLL
ncbi:TIGR00366 family protein [Gallaecimonas sp. GXIMD4217]|uniref:short-chain fatty acid transporter n=1 Tax=Gallaecimonas sp. GXIMD4217 TaxID=3131927 RepID=UPI00311B2A70